MKLVSATFSFQSPGECRCRIAERGEGVSDSETKRGAAAKFLFRSFPPIKIWFILNRVSRSKGHQAVTKGSDEGGGRRQNQRI